jgi:uncharacterized protein with PQ loop repeat
MLWILEWAFFGGHPLLILLATTLLAQAQPLPLLSIGLILTGTRLWEVVSTRTLNPKNLTALFVFGLAAAPWVIYGFVTTQIHPVLSQWNAQNLTPSPSIGESLIWGGVPFALSLIGAWIAFKRNTPTDRFLLVWLVLGVLSLYAPLGLQRRLSMGLWMPITLLAIFALRDVVLPFVGAKGRLPALAAVVLAGVMSNLFVLLLTFGGIFSHHPELFFSAAQWHALQWIESNAGRATVLASPSMGLRIPAFTDARVLYGHPFETVHADVQKQLVTDALAGKISLATLPIQFVFAEAQTFGGQAVFQEGPVTIYALP